MTTSEPTKQTPDLAMWDEATEQALQLLNAANTIPGTCWYAIPQRLSSVARDRGQRARIVFELMTDECAREFDLMD